MGDSKGPTSIWKDEKIKEENADLSLPPPCLCGSKSLPFVFLTSFFKEFKTLPAGYLNHTEALGNTHYPRYTEETCRVIDLFQGQGRRQNPVIATFNLVLIFLTDNHFLLT